MSKIAIIAGTGIDQLLLTTAEFKENQIKTKFGKVIVKIGKIGKRSVIFLNRHGQDYCAPHQINARANLMALKQCGVNKILATAAVGSLNPKMKPGECALLSDFIDFTKGRSSCFDPQKFTDVSFPYDMGMRLKIKKAAAKLKLKLHPEAIYTCTEGPRFETKAEIRLFRQLGGDVIGMTQVPEVVLAAELGIPYAVIALVTNYGAGLSENRVNNDEVVAMMKKNNRLLSQLITEVISRF